MMDNLREYFAKLKIENPDEYERKEVLQRNQYKRNKESRLKYQNQYNQINKDTIQIKQKEYQQQNKDKFKCGKCNFSSYSRRDLNRHLETKKHQRNLPQS